MRTALKRKGRLREWALIGILTLTMGFGGAAAAYDMLSRSGSWSGF
jgi:hypothetical protein